jgi:hypothetical protein
MGNLATHRQRTVTVAQSDVHHAQAELLRRIQAEYRVLSGLCLTGRQAQRLFGLEPTLCDRLLETLVRTHFLARTPQGMFIRFGM